MSQRHFIHFIRRIFPNAVMGQWYPGEALEFYPNPEVTNALTCIRMVGADGFLIVYND